MHTTVTKNRTAAIYTRVSSEQQREAQTIKSQTSALCDFARKEGYIVPQEWIFEDEGYSGSTLLRPGLEHVRDLAAGGEIEAVLVYSPDRLSRKYAYQVLLMEEMSRNGVEVIFANSPPVQTPEEQLLIQFQGMIAEYERAQITERSRRGKRHKARSGSVNVLAGAPYGYRYVKKSDSVVAFYEINEAEAEVVRKVFTLYTSNQVSIGEVTRYLNEQGIPTRKGISVWERSTVWAMLRNPAYKGKACFGKTKQVQRKKVTRLLRLRGGHTPRSTSSTETPKQEWIEIAVPPIISEQTYELAQQRLEENKRFATRRTTEPTLLQGLLVCRKCSYAYYRTSTRTSKKKIYYYRCLGSDGWRYGGNCKCQSEPIRQDYLDNLIWDNVMRLLKDPLLIENEISHRIDAAKNSIGSNHRKIAIEKESIRVKNAIQRLIDAYQENLLTMDELRNRTTELRKQEKSLHGQLQNLEIAEAQEQNYFKIIYNLKTFLESLNMRSQNLSIPEKQQIVRAVIKEIQIDGERVHIVHSIPTNHLSKNTIQDTDNNRSPNKSYLLCLGSNQSTIE